ncbi:DUF1127 domain-containing protein [Marinimicrococcus flavescens]|uniref:DUF1127 domain-containing protein n=1 Tax=Marinimicrococcus flavescens TaxID=3031815 RepID=A0AAP3UX48_9PROT|nr:DUF1127 domain-containing protein [Marinimicrococcus flavescens]
MFAAFSRAGHGRSRRFLHVAGSTERRLRLLAAALAVERRLRRDRRMLLAMDERNLEDIGLSRGEILRSRTAED